MNSIPPCCKHYDAASSYGAIVYKEYLNVINQLSLSRAKAIWAAGQDANAAVDAAYLVSTIDPKSSSFAEGQTLLAEIKAQMRSDIDFEVREKYRYEIALRGKEADAWRAVGVAYGNGQQPTTTYINWIK